MILNNKEVHVIEVVRNSMVFEVLVNTKFKDLPSHTKTWLWDENCGIYWYERDNKNNPRYRRYLKDYICEQYFLTDYDFIVFKDGDNLNNTFDNLLPKKRK